MARGTDRPDLVKDLQRQVTLLETDLRARSEEVPDFAKPLRAEYDEAFAAKRTAATYETWRDERITQVAAAWILGTVFVRFCEDNGLIEWPFLAGPGERLADAEERHESYFRTHPERNDRDWIIESFTHLSAAHPTAAGLFDRNHNPLWEITPSFEAATALLQFWRRRADDGEIRHNFTDESLETRFLGDLYQDLSESARKTYALLQTPEFVEEFILDLTLDPAVEEFGLPGLRTIDPACGSGHFLLGIFRRLLTKWREAEPGTNRWTLIRRSLDSVHGCDKNPFAVSIARFRLLVAVLHASGEKRLHTAPKFPINIAVGDSLMHGRGVNWEQIELDLGVRKLHSYRTEDVHEFADRDLLGLHSYHVVVGNPPYITVKDKQENENYREVYKKVCSGKYALSVPFAQRLFDLAIRTNENDRDAGFVGQITANSFMKREFGKNLILDFLPLYDLTHVIDTSGAYIPGHGTPTVILAGKNRPPRKNSSVRLVRGVQGEPRVPQDPRYGLVWQSIESGTKTRAPEGKWVTSDDVDRVRYLGRYPWILTDGGLELIESLEFNANRTNSTTPLLGSLTQRIGFYGVMGSDEAMTMPESAYSRIGAEKSFYRPLTIGDEVRDWRIASGDCCFHPYDENRDLVDLSSMPKLADFLWPYRTELGNRATFSKGTYFTDGRPWFEWHQIPKDANACRHSITFAFVATHNHFVLDLGGKVFNRSAPLIKLPQGASRDNHLSLLAVLNSSAACFWLKQVSYPKGGDPIGDDGARVSAEAWSDRYEFTGTKLQEFPLPPELPLEFGRLLDSLAQGFAMHEPSAVCADAVLTRERLARARDEHERIRGRMIALQEELDWHMYGSYGLLGVTEVNQLTAPDRDSVPDMRLGERAFEIVLARRMAAGEIETTWFDRHGSPPITKVPEHWPAWYQRIVQGRIDIIEKRRDIGLIERPECKRRWASESWEKKEAEALRNWLLDRCERRDLWFGLRDGFEQPRTLTVNQLADQFRDDVDMQSVARLYATDHLGKRDLTLAQVLERIVADEHVPYLAALRYKDSGLRKREQWEQVWKQQREEDRTGQRLDIPVPPKYTSADFRKNSYWTQRGKLDVPKERFISYPEASPDADPTLLLGWAGWDHKDQAQALVNLVNDRTTDAGWGTDKLAPLLAGLAEVMPWVRQWHGEHDEGWGGVPAEEFGAFLEEQRAKHHLTEQDLTGWRPEPSRRGRRGVKDSTK